MQSSLIKKSYNIQGEIDRANVLMVKGDLLYEERCDLP